MKQEITKKKQKQIVFVMEYRVGVGEDMDLPIGEILEKMRETGSANVIDTRIDKE